MASQEHLLQLVVIGERDVGKSLLVERFTQDDTVGVEYKTKVVELKDETINLQIHDTVSDDIASSCFREAHGVVIVFSFTDTFSFSKIKQQLSDIDRYASENVYKIIVGNKSQAEKKTVSSEEAKELAKGLGIQFTETDALNNYGVEEAFRILVEEIYHKKINKRNPSQSKLSASKEKDCSIM